MSSCLDRQDDGGAGPTPFTDGDNVFVVFGNLGVIAIDSHGEEMWRRTVALLDTFYGHAASPILARNALVILFDQNRRRQDVLGQRGG